jgi:hypothetical protein
MALETEKLPSKWTLSFEYSFSLYIAAVTDYAKSGCPLILFRGHYHTIDSGS